MRGAVGPAGCGAAVWAVLVAFHCGEGALAADS